MDILWLLSFPSRLGWIEIDSTAASGGRPAPRPLPREHFRERGRAREGGPHPYPPPWPEMATGEGPVRFRAAAGSGSLSAWRNHWQARLRWLRERPAERDAASPCSWGRRARRSTSPAERPGRSDRK